MNQPVAACALTFAIAAMATPASGNGYQGVLVRAGATAASAVRANAFMVARPNVVMRPLAPFRQVPGAGAQCHRRHGPVVVFVQPSPLFGTQPFGFGYNSFFSSFPFSSPFGFGSWPAFNAAPAVTAEPYYCWVDGIGFTDEGRFLHHLHEVHGVPLDEALSLTESVGERRVFYGY
jgi:hypothetical protein